MSHAVGSLKAVGQMSWEDRVRLRQQRFGPKKEIPGDCLTDRCAEGAKGNLPPKYSSPGVLARKMPTSPEIGIDDKLERFSLVGDENEHALDGAGKTRHKMIRDNRPNTKVWFNDARNEQPLKEKPEGSNIAPSEVDAYEEESVAGSFKSRRAPTPLSVSGGMCRN